MFKCLFVFSLFFVLQVSFSADLTVKIAVNPPSQLYLMGYYGAEVQVVDSFVVSGGNAFWSSDTRLDEGIYFLTDGVEGSRFDFLVGRGQSIVINLKSLGDHDASVAGADESVAFCVYQNFVADLSRTKEEKLAYTHKALQNAGEGTFLALVLSALLPPPSKAFSESLLVVDQSDSYDYNAAHYWDNYDLSDERLVRTPFLVPHVESFLRRVLKPREDMIMPKVLDFLETIDANEPLVKVVVSTVLRFSNERRIMGIDALAYEMVTRYFLSGRFGVLPQRQQEMLERFVFYTKNCRVGHVAKDIRIEAFDKEKGEVSLFEEEAKYTLVVFWEPNCDYCTEVLPVLRDQVYRVYNKQGLSIFAVNTQSDYDAWSQYVLANDLMDWTHGYSPNGLASFMSDYGVQGTPFMYILDDEKRIVAKDVKLAYIVPMLDRLFATGSIYK